MAKITGVKQTEPTACYIAKGDWQELNGNYSAGILEGLVHYHPDLANTVAAIIRAIRSAN